MSQIPICIGNKDDFLSSIRISNLQKTGGSFSNSTSRGKQKENEEKCLGKNINDYQQI